jgi:alcohol dehydrogenase, propanol-preferring
MSAWVSGPHAGAIEHRTVPVPVAGPGEVLVKVLACGVCRTDLHVIDRELPVHRPGVIPGHQVVAEVIALGPDVRRLRIGDLVGVAWLGFTCGVCRWCRSGRENLCPDSRFTGWDIDGGYAEYLTALEAYIYLLPAETDPVETAPLLCAGIIGFRALTRAHLPPGGRLGIYGFGSSAHLTAQLAMSAGAEVFAMTRGQQNRELARRLGVSFVGESDAVPPDPLDSAIIFAPAGNLVPLALEATAPGGTVVIAGIHLSDVPSLNYEKTLFYERDLRTVTANTRADGAQFLAVARNLSQRPSVTRYTTDEVDKALNDLRAGRSSGSLVIVSS